MGTSLSGGVTAPDQVCRGLTDADGSLPRRLIPASGFTKFSPVGASFPVLPQFSLRPISLFPSAISCSESRPQPVRPDLSGSHGCLFSLLVCPLSDEPQRSLGTLLSQFLLLSFHCLFLSQWLSILAVHSNHFVNLERICAQAPVKTN